MGALDGLRGLAIAAVLAYHAVPSWFRGGYLGVEMFFVLSGFLIVSLLLDEEKQTGRFDWSAYAVRRLRRVAPALLAFLVALVVFAPLFAGGDTFRLRGDVLWTAGGLTNWHLIRDGSSYFGQLGRPPLVRHLWSLAIELQFYVACPALVVLVARRRVRTAAAFLGAGIALSAVAMAMLYRAADPSRAYYGTDARIGALLTGALLAVLVINARVDLRARAWWPGAALGAGGMATLAALFLFAGERSRFMYPAGFLLCRLATVAVILACLTRGRVATALSRRVPRWLGTRSYSIYLWHWPLLALLRPRIDVGWSPAVAVTVAVLGSLALGELSYRVIEQPALRRRRPVFRPRRLPTGVRWSWAIGSFGVVCLLLASLPSTDPIAASLKAGQQVVASEHSVPPSTGAAAPQPTTVAALTATATGPSDTELASAPVSHVAEPAPPTTVAPPPPAAVAVAAIGDSVMLGAAGPLQARLGPPGFIDAKVSRQFAEGVVTAQQLRDQGRLGQVAVVHLGTNGPPTTRDVDGLMAALAAVPRVLLVTVRMPRRWEAQTNDTLRAAAARYPAVVVVDWFAYSDGHRDWFASDGIHLKPLGAQAYADLVAAAVPPPPQPPPPPPAPPKPAPSPYTRKWRWSSWASFYGGRSPR